MGNLWFELTGEYYKSVKKLESTDLLISQQFQRIYNSAYLLKGNSLDLLSQRAAVIYEFFPDILFELFSFDPPEKKYIESITKQMILYWNVASTRFDYCYYFAEKCVQVVSQ